MELIFLKPIIKGHLLIKQNSDFKQRKKEMVCFFSIMLSYF